MSAVRTASNPAGRPVMGVRNPGRLAAVASTGLVGHDGDLDLEAIVSTLQIACRVPIAVINLVTADLQTYPAEVGVGSACTRVPDGVSFCAEVVETGKLVIVPDASLHPVYSHNPLVKSRAVMSYAGEPLVDHGVVLGSVSIFDAAPRVFTPHELELLRHQARLAAAVLSLRRSTRTDWLTGLPNRAMVRDRLLTALSRLDRHSGVVAVLFVDVDGFKSINDEQGHEVGDELLVALTSRMSESLRPSDTLARFGGDEFVLVCEDVGSSQEACAIAERLVGRVRRSLSVGGSDIAVSISVGVAVATSAAHDPDSLIRQADVAMYRAKRVPGPQWILADANVPNGAS